MIVLQLYQARNPLTKIWPSYEIWVRYKSYWNKYEMFNDYILPDRGALMYPSLEFLARLWTMYKFLVAVLPRVSRATFLLKHFVSFLYPKLEICPTFMCSIAQPGETNRQLIIIVLKKFLTPLLKNRSAIANSNTLKKAIVPFTKNRRITTLDQ